MANLQAEKKWSPVRLLETNELARGGLNGNMNEQAKALLDRTEWLNDQKASKGEIVQGHFAFNTLADFNAKKADIPVNSTVIIAAAGANQGENIWNGSTLSKSPYDPFMQAQDFVNANALFKPAAVGDFANLNTFATSGIWFQNSNTFAANGTNYPEVAAGTLFVRASDIFVYQEYWVRGGAARYARATYATGLFSNWQRLSLSEETDSKVAASKQQIKDDLTVEGSKNMFNPATVKVGYRLSGSGVVAAVANTKCSDYIAVDGGETYTISATEKPTGVAFYEDRGTVPLLYSAAALSPQTIKAPAKSRFMVVNVKRETDSADAINLQVEKGNTATAYAAYGANPVLRKSTLPSDVVTTATVARASAKPYDIITDSKNLFDENNVVLNNYLTNSGATSGSTGWARTGLIAVTPGQTYTLSGTRNRQGVTCFANNTDLTSTGVVQYIADATMPLTFTVPAGAYFVAFNLQSSSAQGWSNIQFEQGAVATIYVPFGAAKFQIDGSVIVNLPASANTGLGVFTGGTTQQTIKGMQGADTILHTVTMTKAATHAGSRVFNWISTALNNVVLHICGDDAAPCRINETTLGGNHGYSRTILTAAGHGKTLVDVGSVWKDEANKEWVIVSIDSTGALAVTARTTNTAITATSGILTHVGGATNTASINWTAVSAQQWYPMLKNHKITVTADGKPVDPTSITPVQFEKLIIAQSYELMTKPAIVEWLIAHVGSSTDFTEYSAASNVSVSMAYAFDKYGNCTFASDFLALDSVALTTGDSAALMFHQTARLTPALDGNVLYYMPNALSLNHEGVTYNFASKADVSTFAPSTRLNMTLDRVVAGKSINRVVQLTNNWGYASGFLPILDASPANRNTLASNKFLQLNNAQAKIYFSALDNGTLTLNPGDYHSVVAYRNYFRRPTERTDNYAVQSRQGDYYFMDWHAATTDRVPLPAEYQGRAFTVVDKSDSVTVLSQTATNSIAVKTIGAGYAVLLFK